MAPPKIIQATDASFESEILRSELPAIVDFWATWSGPCSAISAAVVELAERYGDEVKVAMVNVDENPLIPSNYGITSIPTLLVFQNGEVVRHVSGAIPKPQLEELFAEVIGEE